MWRYPPSCSGPVDCEERVFDGPWLPLGMGRGVNFIYSFVVRVSHRQRRQMKYRRIIQQCIASTVFPNSPEFGRSAFLLFSWPSALISTVFPGLVRLCSVSWPTVLSGLLHFLA